MKELLCKVHPLFASQRPFLVLSWAVFVVSLFIACQSNRDQPDQDYQQWTGEELAKEFCSRCHLYTDPSWLPKAQWKSVLDRMALHLGIKTGIDPYKGKLLEEVFMIQQANVFADEPLMNDTAWQRLVEFYLTSAPDTFIRLDQSNVDLNHDFKASFPPVGFGGFPVVTMVQFDTVSNQLYLADLNNRMIRLNHHFREDQITEFLAPVVHLARVNEEKLLLTEIGFIDNNDQRAGLIEMTDQKSLSQRATMMIELIRPVFLETADLDGDGALDLLVCSFGNLVGDLAWYKYHEGSYVKNIIRSTPGAIRTQLIDTDQDQDLDILALFGQAQEGLSLFINHKGNFQEKKLIEFNPLFGCSAFQAIDFDRDGDLDILLTNGDNGDYSFVNKPYHGLRIFENLGDWKLKERLFVPINGATGLQCADFDEDGDLDLFVHAFYPDFGDDGRTSLFYLENQGGYQMVRSGFESAVEGRWLTSDIGDLDLDGDLDIFVGSFILGPGIIPDRITDRWRNSEKYLLYLENRLK